MIRDELNLTKSKRVKKIILSNDGKCKLEVKLDITNVVEISVRQLTFKERLDALRRKKKNE